MGRAEGDGQVRTLCAVSHCGCDCSVLGNRLVVSKINRVEYIVLPLRSGRYSHQEACCLGDRLYVSQSKKKGGESEAGIASEEGQPTRKFGLVTRGISFILET